MSPEDIVEELWPLLEGFVAVGQTGLARDTARRIDQLLSLIPEDQPHSRTRPGVEGMRRFSLVAEQLGRLEEAIGWRQARVDFVRQVLARDPSNALGVFTFADLRDDLRVLDRLYRAAGRQTEANLVIDEIRRDPRLHG